MVTRRFAVIAAIAVAIGGCTAEAKDDPARADELAVVVADAYDLDIELDEALDRITRACLEIEGFEIHHELDTRDPEHELQLLGTSPPDGGLIPSLTQAQESGMNDLIAPDAPASGAQGETEGFMEQPVEYRQAYYASLYGEQWAEVLETDAPVGDGCHRQTNELAFSDVEGFDPAGLSGANWRPMWPAVFDGEVRTEAYETDALADARMEWADCMEEAGRPGFDLNEREVATDISIYIDLHYDTAEAVEERYGIDLASWPFDPPQGAPWVGEQAFEQEKKFAADVAQCGVNTGLTEVMADSWNTAMRELLAEYEPEILAWHDDLESALAAAQDALEQ